MRLGDKDGRDTTVYVNFDSNSKYFYGKDGAKNREKLINNIKSIY